MVDRETLKEAYKNKAVLSQKQLVDFEALHSKFNRNSCNPNEIRELWVYQELIFYQSLKNHKT